MRALLIVDAQNDFTEGGALGVNGATDAFRETATHLAEHASDYAVLVTTQDWHHDPGAHWSPTPDFQESWPRHCPAGEPGAELHPIISQALTGHEVLAVFKGQYAAAYSGFEGHTADGVALVDALRERGIEEVDVVGVATDYCVRATALDAVREGFRTRLLTDQVAAVHPSGATSTLCALADAGVKID